MKSAFLEIFSDKVKRPGADKYLEWLETTDFFEAPASTRFHLSRPGGLCTHHLHTYWRLRERYMEEKQRNMPGPVELTPEEEESIAIVALTHDACKIDLYKMEPKNQKTYDPDKVKAAQRWQIKHDALGDFIWETVMGYKHDEELPYGHGEKSVYIVSSFMKLSREEAMAIRWHMGFSDISFKGGSQDVGTAFGKYPLAVMMHIADLEATFLDEAEEKT